MQEKDNFGQITLVLGIVLYVAAILFFVMPLPYKLDTFVFLTWVFGPVIIGAIYYSKIAKEGGWDQSRTLK